MVALLDDLALFGSFTALTARTSGYGRDLTAVSIVSRNEGDHPCRRNRPRGGSRSRSLRRVTDGMVTVASRGVDAAATSVHGAAARSGWVACPNGRDGRLPVAQRL